MLNDPPTNKEYIMLKPGHHIEIETHTVSEVHVDLNREALKHIARDAEYVIIRVQTRGPSGRPSSKTMRLHRSQLEDPKIPTREGGDLEFT